MILFVPVEAIVEELAAQTLSKNIWELHRAIESGKATARARQMLLRAYSEQVAAFEDALGVDGPDRAFILDREDSREGVLLVHGATGSPRDLRDLAEAIHGAGFNVYCIRLPGHGVEGPNAQHDNWESCLVELEERYAQFNQCCKNLIVVGYSFGATLAMQMELQPRPSALVMLAPALFPRLNRWQRLLMTLKLDRFERVRRWMGWQAELLDAMAAARKQKWWYGLPVLAAMCKDDTRIDARSMGFLRSRLSHHRNVLREFDTGGHTFHLGPHADEVHREVLAFLHANRPA